MAEWGSVRVPYVQGDARGRRPASFAPREHDLLPPPPTRASSIAAAMKTSNSMCLRTIGLGGLLAAATLAGCDRPPKNQPLPSSGSEETLTAGNVEFPRQKAEMPAVETVEARPEPESDQQMTGRLGWDEDDTSYLFSPVSGRVEKILGRIGQKVSIGEDLAWLRSPDYAQALAADRTAAADLVQAKGSLDRENRLRTKGAAAVQDEESAQAGYEQALAEKQRADLWLQQLGTTPGDSSDIYHVRSPIAGVIVDMKINPGQEVRSDIQLAGVADLVKPMFTISDPARLWVRIDVPEGQLNLLKPGDAVDFRTPAYPGKVFSGKLAVVGTSLDPQTRVAHARATVDNSGGLLRAEMYVTVQLPHADNEAAAVEIPASAVFFQDGKYDVVTQSGPHTFDVHEVSLVHEGSAGVSVVVRGIPAGQRIVNDVGRSRQQLVQAGEVAALPVE